MPLASQPVVCTALRPAASGRRRGLIQLLLIRRNGVVADVEFPPIEPSVITLVMSVLP